MDGAKPYGLDWCDGCMLLAGGRTDGNLSLQLLLHVCRCCVYVPAFATDMQGWRSRRVGEDLATDGVPFN